MKKAVCLLFIIIFFLGCSRQESVRNVELVIDSFEEPEISLQNTDYNEKPSFTETRINSIDEIIGTFLNLPYLSTLYETRSHIFSIRKAHNEYNIPAQEIIIFDDRILFIFNLHEGVAKEIIEINGNFIVFNNRFLNDNRIEIRGNDEIMFDNVIYRKVTNETTPGPRGKYGVKKYITNIIFGDMVFSNDNGDKLFRLENGNISYRNEEYHFNYGFLFENQNFDRLNLVNRTRDWPPEAYWIEIIKNEVFVFELSENPPGVDEWVVVGDFILVDILRKDEKNPNGT